MELTRNFKEEDVQRLKDGTYWDHNVVDEYAAFCNVNGKIEAYNENIAALCDKRPCPIKPEPLVIKKTKAARALGIA